MYTLNKGPCKLLIKNVRVYLSRFLSLLELSLRTINLTILSSLTRLIVAFALASTYYFSCYLDEMKNVMMCNWRLPNPTGNQAY